MGGDLYLLNQLKRRVSVLGFVPGSGRSVTPRVAYCRAARVENCHFLFTQCLYEQMQVPHSRSLYLLRTAGMVLTQTQAETAGFI